MEKGERGLESESAPGSQLFGRERRDESRLELYTRTTIENKSISIRSHDPSKP